MFSKSILRIKPFQLLSRRLLTTAEHQPSAISKLITYAPNQTLTNGTKGQNVLFQYGLLLQTYRRQLPKAGGALLSVTFTMMLWCFAIMMGNDFINDVPFGFERTAALRVVKYGDNPVVEFN
ncbi:hypothetical protein DFJ63DRAFT_310686 [Scheffersomyces coipomensis]|uniref:uncharacterized protein n=1 Tax=Scheffersomyces coipomensis TaxID=1788519 RepID=UPI00315DF746